VENDKTPLYAHWSLRWGVVITSTSTAAASSPLHCLLRSPDPDKQSLIAVSFLKIYEFFDFVDHEPFLGSLIHVAGRIAE
jgi:hypothetical protein